MKNLCKCAVILTAIFLLSSACTHNDTVQNANTSATSTNEPSTAAEQNNAVTPTNTAPSPLTPAPTSEAALVAPISRPKERITKKPFGIYITPKTSPVQPEKFTGYHSGTDFETFPEEQNTDVQINVICDGKLASKRTATGYGGVATQYCTIDGKKVTVIYGHMRLSSIIPQAGDILKAGDHLGVLGTGYSTETSDERKHLHLGIEIGQGTDIRGYVQQQSQLSSFLDAAKILGL